MKRVPWRFAAPSATGLAGVAAAMAGAGIVALSRLFLVYYVREGTRVVEVGAVVAGLVAFGLVLFASRWPRYVVGRDGILVRGLFGTRFVPAADVRRVVALPSRMLMPVSWIFSTPVIRVERMRNGVIEPPLVLRVPEGQVEALTARMHEAFSPAARARGGAASIAPARLASFDRAGQPVAAFRAALARMLAEKHFREAGVTREDAIAALEDPRVAPAQRVAAAVALASTDAEARLRIAEAAAQATHPRVRVALERLADGDLEADEVERALAES